MTVRTHLRTTMFQALRQFATSVPNLTIVLITSLAFWLTAYYIGRQPAVAESVWFGLCSAGFLYHWSGLRELYADRSALLRWPDHDDVDLEAIDNQIRRERSRMIAKWLFGAAGLVMMFVPPRVDESSDVVQQIVVVFLIGAILGLDVDAVLNRLSIRRQMNLIRSLAESRRNRRRILEDSPKPAIMEMVSETSIRGRKIAHDANGQLSVAFGGIEVLKMNPDLSSNDRDMLEAVSSALDRVTVNVAELHELIRNLDPVGVKSGPRTHSRPN